MSTNYALPPIASVPAEVRPAVENMHRLALELEELTRARRDAEVAHESSDRDYRAAIARALDTGQPVADVPDLRAQRASDHERARLAEQAAKARAEAAWDALGDTIRAHAEAGPRDLDQGVEKASAHYLEAIATVEQARQKYADALALRAWWSWITEPGKRNRVGSFRATAPTTEVLWTDRTGTKRTGDFATALELMRGDALGLDRVRASEAKAERLVQRRKEAEAQAARRAAESGAPTVYA